MPLRREGGGSHRPVATLWGQRHPVEGERAQLRPLGARFRPAPRLASLFTPPDSREGGRTQGGLADAAIANANAPTSLSSLLLLGLHRIGESTDDAPWVGAGG